MDSQDTPYGDDRVAKSLSKKPYAPPVLLVLGSFSELTLTVGHDGRNDGGRQGWRRSTRA